MAIVALCEITLPLVRGVGLAHILSPEQFGIALTVTIAASVLELITDLGIGQLALKQRSHAALDTLHSVLLVRAVPLGLIIAASGPIFGAIFHTPGAAWIYSVVGLSSALRGCVHLEMKRSMQDHNYNGEALSSISSQVAWTVVSFAAALWLRDYRAMVFGTLAATIAYVGVSHLVAARPWRLAWDRSTASETLRYGGPLAFNGMATALANFGDRMLTGATIGVTELAQYTALATSAFLPRSAIVKYTTSIVTSHFVNADGPRRVRHVGQIWLIIVMIITSVFGTGYNLLGQVATSFVFGKAYHQPQTLISAVALLGSIRYMSLLSGPPALAFGHTGLLARITVLSTSGLAIGAAMLFISPSLDHLVFGLAFGESLALLYASIRTCRIADIHLGFGGFAIWTPLVVLSAITAFTYVDPEPPTALRVSVVAIGFALQVSMIAVLMRLSGVGLSEALRFVFPRRLRTVVA